MLELGLGLLEDGTTVVTLANVQRIGNKVQLTAFHVFTSVEDLDTFIKGCQSAKELFFKALQNKQSLH